MEDELFAGTYDAGIVKYHHLKSEKWYFVTKIVLTYLRKNCSSDREKLLKFEAECQEFSKFIQTVKGQNNVW